MLVIKFGGTSLATPARIRRAALRVRAHYRSGRRVVVVVSAMGHTTDRLLRTLSLCAPHAETRAAREVDRVLATGEELSAAAVAAALVALAVPAFSMRGGEAGLIATGRFGHGSLQDLRRDRLQSLLDAGIVPVVAGFQAARPDGQTITLGRGGSDTSAVFLAGMLRASQCHIVTDVQGVFDADPRTHPDATAYRELSFFDLIRLVDEGAHVVHPRAARFARDFRVPLHIYHFKAAPRQPGGTVVGSRAATTLEEAV
jgi:aspartate kinase